MLHLITKLSLTALWAIMAGIILVTALPGGGVVGLSAAVTMMEERLPTPYVGVCFNNNKCDEGKTTGNSHDVPGDGKSDIQFTYTCDSFLPTIGDGYACKVGCGKGKSGGCSALTDGKCMQAGPFKFFCAKG